jgi:hypothetical protein
VILVTFSLGRSAVAVEGPEVLHSLFAADLGAAWSAEGWSFPGVRSYQRKIRKDSDVMVSAVPRYSSVVLNYSWRHFKIDPSQLGLLCRRVETLSPF